MNCNVQFYKSLHSITLTNLFFSLLKTPLQQSSQKSSPHHQPHLPPSSPQHPPPFSPQHLNPLFPLPRSQCLAIHYIYVASLRVFLAQLRNNDKIITREEIFVGAKGGQVRGLGEGVRVL